MSEPTPNPYDPLDSASPDQGFLPPDEAYREAVPVPDPEHDPLVNPLGQGLSGWVFRVGGVLRRSWRELAVIFAVTHLLPIFLFSVLAVAGLVGLAGIDLNNVVSSQLDFEQFVVALVVTGVVFVLLVLLLQMLGYAAATYLATRQAAGLPVTVGAALRYGVRRMLGLTLWHLLAYLLFGIAVAAVSVCCFRIADLLGLVPVVLVGVYLWLVFALIGPAFLFERRSPLRRSSSLLHAAFWPTTGRLLLLGLTLAAGSAFEQLLGKAAGLLDASYQGVAEVGVTLLGAVVDIPLTMVLFAGILITYGERRGAEEDLTTPQLVDELR